jgi:hypothetical protein
VQEASFGLVRSAVAMVTANVTLSPAAERLVGSSWFAACTKGNHMFLGAGTDQLVRHVHLTFDWNSEAESPSPG